MQPDWHPAGTNGRPRIQECVSAAGIKIHWRELQTWVEVVFSPAVSVAHPCVSFVVIFWFTLCVPGLKKPAGLVQMDAILKCRPDDLEDYYNLLECDELSTVRAFPTALPANILSVLIYLQGGFGVFYVYRQDYVKCIVNLLSCCF